MALCICLNNYLSIQAFTKKILVFTNVYRMVGTLLDWTTSPNSVLSWPQNLDFLDVWMEGLAGVDVARQLPIAVLL